ncbi:hypothetical protein [Nocardia bovistercoris]|uniref:Uncharacterized protein n=1 Tax=Nocardia bovistercoris TaxID=2785916 RepID=A0A931IBS3_9NOCA|nr:hypothetical protein [Nocardia bovistercoris]MBH0776913.1 hypothetical protein [Nocardia bovistercoris]
MITALVSAVVGGLALSTPVSLAWARGSTATVQIELLATNMPRAAAIGCIAGVVVAVFASIAESLIVPWVCALSGMGLLLLNHLLGRSLSSIAPLTTLNYIDSLAGGILLGGLVAAVSVRLVLTIAFLLGSIISVSVGQISAVSGYGSMAAHGIASWFVDSPPLWLIWPTAVAMAWCTMRYRHGKRYATISVDLPLSPILAAVIGVNIPVLGSEWMVRNGTETGDIVFATILTVLAALVAGRLLPGRDGMLFQLSITLGTVGIVIVPIPLPLWIIPFSILGNLLGLLAGLWRGSPVAAMLMLMALAVFGVAATSPTDPVPGAAIAGTIVLAFITGYCFSAALPKHSSSVMLGVALLFVPGVVVAMKGRMFTTDPELALNNATPGLTALAIAAGCMANLLILRRRPVVEPEPAELSLVTK